MSAPTPPAAMVVLTSPEITWLPVSTVNPPPSQPLDEAADAGDGVPTAMMVNSTLPAIQSRPACMSFLRQIAVAEVDRDLLVGRSVAGGRNNAFANQARQRVSVRVSLFAAAGGSRPATRCRKR